MTWRPILIISLTTVAGCDDFRFSACTGVDTAGLSVDVRDARTGARLVEGTQVMAEDGGYREALSGPREGVFTGAYERPGTYRVVVGHPGYRSVVLDGVAVTADHCHVSTVSLRIELDRVAAD